MKNMPETGVKRERPRTAGRGDLGGWAWGETGSPTTSLGRKCLLIICVGVSACRRTTGEEGEARGKARLTRLSPAAMKLTEGRRTAERGWKPQVARGHNEETQPSQKESLSESERHRWAGREGERVTEKGRESCRFPPPFLPASSAALAVPCSGEERLQKPSLRLHVWTQSLPLPC